MKTLICLLAITVALCGCRKDNEANSPTTATRWEYRAFEYHDPDFASYKGYIDYCYIEWSAGITNWSGSNNLNSVNEVLDLAGEHGWELVWRDNYKFIMKRPIGIFTNGNFLIHETMVKYP